MEKPIPCLDDVQWREVGKEPVEGPWTFPKTNPQVGERRWGLLGNDPEAKIPISGKGWLLMHSDTSYYNGLFDSPLEIDDVAVVEVEVFEHREPPEGSPWLKKPHSYSPRYYWSKVKVLKIVPLIQIPEQFPISTPTGWPELPHAIPNHKSQDRRWPNEKLVRTSVGSFRVYQAGGEARISWFLTTRSNPPKVILRADGLQWDRFPLEICNVEFNESTCPYTIIEAEHYLTARDADYAKTPDK